MCLKFPLRELEKIKELVNERSGNVIDSYEQLRTEDFYYLKPNNCVEDEDDKRISEEANSVFNLRWLNYCVEKQHFIGDEFILWKPLNFALPLDFMKGIHISITGFETEREKEMVVLLIIESGAKYDQRFSRKHTTHLICKYPTDKHSVALEWKTAAIVSLDWLINSVKQNKKCNEAEFFLSDGTENSGKYFKHFFEEKNKRRTSKNNNDIDIIHNNYNGDDFFPSTQPVERKRPLKGINIVFAKNLKANKIKLQEIALRLGANVSFEFFSHITHLIQTSKPNKQESKLIEEFKPFVVSPEWIYECERINSKANEIEFPLNYNPKMKLMLTPEVSNSQSNFNNNNNQKNEIFKNNQPEKYNNTFVPLLIKNYEENTLGNTQIIENLRSNSPSPPRNENSSFNIAEKQISSHSSSNHQNSNISTPLSNQHYPSSSKNNSNRSQNARKSLNNIHYSLPLQEDHNSNQIPSNEHSFPPQKDEETVHSHNNNSNHESSNNFNDTNQNKFGSHNNNSNQQVVQEDFVEKQTPIQEINNLIQNNQNNQELDNKSDLFEENNDFVEEKNENFHSNNDNSSNKIINISNEEKFNRELEEIMLTSKIPPFPSSRQDSINKNEQKENDEKADDSLSTRRRRKRSGIKFPLLSDINNLDNSENKENKRRKSKKFSQEKLQKEEKENEGILFLFLFLFLFYFYYYIFILFFFFLEKMVDEENFKSDNFVAPSIVNITNKQPNKMEELSESDEDEVYYASSQAFFKHSPQDSEYSSNSKSEKISIASPSLSNGSTDYKNQPEFAKLNDFFVKENYVVHSTSVSSKNEVSPKKTPTSNSITSSATFKFVISRMQANKKKDYERIIRKLGAVVTENLDNTITHLIIGEPGNLFYFYFLI